MYQLCPYLKSSLVSYTVDFKEGGENSGDEVTPQIRQWMCMDIESF